MPEEETAQSYFDALFDTDRDRAIYIIKAALARGMPPEEIIFSIVVPSLNRMSDSMITGSLVTLSQHFLAAQIAEEVTDMLVPLFKSSPDIQGRVVIGTSFGDFHGLGKKIVIGCLRANMFLVTDLGINVPPGKFVEEALACDAQVIGISSMMVHTAMGAEGPLKVRSILRERALEDRFKILVGGAPYRFDENLYKQVGADAWAETAIFAADVIAGLIRDLTR